MEILKSEVGESIGESLKQKFVKQICLLLEAIQCHLEGGFFGDWSLDNYVGKIIKARYSYKTIICFFFHNAVAALSEAQIVSYFSPLFGISSVISIFLMTNAILIGSVLQCKEQIWIEQVRINCFLQIYRSWLASLL